MNWSTTKSYAHTITVEKLKRRSVERRPEPDLVMSDPEKVKAYFETSSVYQKSNYTLIVAHLCELIQDGDRVLDLGCGTGNLLVHVAKAFKHANFVGLDLSENMLQYTKENVTNMGLNNVEVVKGDMTKLHELFDEHSFDVVISSGAFHHLPNEESLQLVFNEIVHVLKSGKFLFATFLFNMLLDGRIFIFDFLLLKKNSSIDFVSNINFHLQSELFHEDYFNSLHAAFKQETYETILSKWKLKERASMFRMSFFPLFFCIRSKSFSNQVIEERKELVAQLIEEMKPEVKQDFLAIKRLFSIGGLKTLYA